ncbi:hypothetical protein NLI96_g10479 [Meripilus lineatus]|uniref:RlpA-like protein double-psi beta-barrel domain-containing protein n=1 Tax=Meripilus lineatus TaxID=2056292 RepID=A0AAD5UTI9_9APHY|nr:hypothetical protein NLI96_g10479 [Physisporinus lineatus]
MFSFSSVVAVTLSALSAVNGLAIPRGGAPSTYNEGYLEKYDVYHARYVAIGCTGKQGTAFFDKCCHPLLATETLQANRPAECRPGSAVSTKASPTPAADDDDDDCEDDDDEDDSSSVATPKSTPTPTKAPVNAAPSPDVTPSTSKASPPKSSSKAPTPKPSSSKAASKPAATPADTGSGETFTGGFATFYYQGGAAGACGDFHSDNDLIAAIDERRYGNANRKSSLCGRKVHLTNTKNGKSVTVTIKDDCPTCENANSIDLSVAAFNRIATEEEGMVPIKWQFL